MQPNIKRFPRTVRPLAWTAGLDWIRRRVDWDPGLSLARDAARQIQETDYRKGSSIKRWSFQGFNGWRSESIRWGERGGSLIWEASGERAAPTAALMVKSGGYALRIDLQITLLLSTSLPSFGMYLLPSSPETTRTPLRRRTQVGLATANSGLWLGTVGRRTSPSYIRIYDKGVESKTRPLGELWRVELEAKKRHARTLWNTHSESLATPEFCARYTISSLTRSGSTWPFAGLGDTPIDAALGRKEETPAWRLALWLQHSVRPAIPRLLNVFSVAEVLEMLGMKDVAAPTGRDNGLSELTPDDGPR